MAVFYPKLKIQSANKPPQDADKNIFKAGEKIKAYDLKYCFRKGILK